MLQFKIHFSVREGHAAHAISIAGNERGDDYFATDNHAHLDVLKEAVTLLGEHDRLILCGDVLDRGPNNLENIRYINEQNQRRTAGQKKVIVIRGNHEDTALDVINFIEICNVIYKKSQMPGAWSRFKNTAPNAWLKDLDDVILEKIKTFALEFFAFVRSNPWNNSEEFRVTCNNYMETFEARFPESLEIADFFKCACIAVNDGGGWLFDLKPAQRDEVKAFIEPLPYKIRVEQAINNGKIIPPVDVVHAAPLSERATQEIMLGRHATGSEIWYMTEARVNGSLPMLDTEAGGSIFTQGRSPDSILAITGHTPFGTVDFEHQYAAINVLNLDAETFTTKVMFLVNYTQGTVRCIGAPAEGLDLLDILKTLSIIEVRLSSLPRVCVQAVVNTGSCQFFNPGIHTTEEGGSLLCPKPRKGYNYYSK